MKITPFNDSDQEDLLESAYMITKKEIFDIIEGYRQRKLAEEIDLISELGGLRGLAEKLKVNLAAGLSSAEDHTNRILCFGKNEPPLVVRMTYWEICWQALKDLMIRILLISGIVSLVIGSVWGEDKAYSWVEGFAILAAVIVIVNVTAWNELKNQKTFNELKEKNRKNKSIALLRDGVWTMVHPEILLVGDIIKIENGAIIPVDGILIEASQLEVLESAMTGENENIRKPLKRSVNFA